MPELPKQPSLASKLVGQPARPCQTCWSTHAYVNPIGGTACPSCRPPASPGSVRGWLLAAPTPAGTLVWAIAPAPESPGHSPATTPAPAASETPTDLAPAPTADLYVSARLDWFSAVPGEFAPDVTLAAPSLAPPGVYRRLDLDFLGWMWTRVRRVRDRLTRDEGFRILVDLVHAAVQCGVLQHSDYDPARWIPPPSTYRPPAEFDEDVVTGWRQM